MKKLFLLAVVLTVVACEREDEKVVKHEVSTNKVILRNNNEKALRKSDSDTIRIKNISPAASLREEDEMGEVDPKDINPPRR